MKMLLRILVAVAVIPFPLVASAGSPGLAGGCDDCTVVARTNDLAAACEKLVLARGACTQAYRFIRAELKDDPTDPSIWLEYTTDAPDCPDSQGRTTAAICFFHEGEIVRAVIEGLDLDVSTDAGKVAGR